MSREFYKQCFLKYFLTETAALETVDSRRLRAGKTSILLLILNPTRKSICEIAQPTSIKTEACVLMP